MPGIIDQIRTLLSQGKSSSQVIAMGYKSGTVYKTQRQLAEEGTVYRPPSENPQPRIHERPESSKIGVPRLIETLDPEVEADPDIVQLKIQLRKAQLERQLDEASAPTELESDLAALENRMEEIFTEFRGLEPYVYSCPLVGLRDEHQCSCGAEDQVAAKVVCVACGEERAYSW